MSFWRRRQTNIGQHQHLEAQILSEEGGANTALADRVTALEDAPGGGSVEGVRRFIGPFAFGMDDFTDPLGNDGPGFPLAGAAEALTVGDWWIGAVIDFTTSITGPISDCRLFMGDPGSSDDYVQSNAISPGAGSETLYTRGASPVDMAGGIYEIIAEIPMVWLGVNDVPLGGAGRIWLEVFTPA